MKFLALWQRSITFFIIVMMCFAYVMGDQDDCSPLDDKFMNKRGRCARCKRCPFGKGRNFEKAKAANYTLDMTKCLPCEVCPDGTFNDNLIISKNECSPCTANKCKGLRRDIRKTCSRIEDEQCGNCEPGYWDCNDNIELQCCEVKKVPEEPPVANISFPNDGPTTYDRLVTENKTDDSNNVIVILAALIGLILIVVIVIAVFMKRNRDRSCATDAIANTTCVHSTTSVSTSGSEDSALLKVEVTGEINNIEYVDVDTDGPPMHPRGELHNPNPNSGSQLSVPGGAQSTVAPNNKNQGMHPQHRYNTVCSCDDTQCKDACKHSSYDEKQARINDKLLERITKCICHDPKDFYQNLHIPDSEIYNIEDDRNRAPLEISQHECIFRTLKRWVEMEAGHAVYRRIRVALCAGGFHRINTECFRL